MYPAGKPSAPVAVWNFWAKTSSFTYSWKQELKYTPIKKINNFIQGEKKNQLLFTFWIKDWSAETLKSFLLLFLTHMSQIDQLISNHIRCKVGYIDSKKEFKTTLYMQYQVQQNRRKLSSKKTSSIREIELEILQRNLGKMYGGKWRGGNISNKKKTALKEKKNEIVEKDVMERMQKKRS